MTLTVDGQVRAPAGVEMEVVEVWDGVERSRYRMSDGMAFNCAVFGSKTLILRERTLDSVYDGHPITAAQAVAAVDAALTAAGAVPAGFEDGDVEPDVLALGQQVFDAQERALHVLGQFLFSEGQLVQIELYDDLVQAYEAYAGAVAALHAYEESISGAA